MDHYDWSDLQESNNRESEVIEFLLPFKYIGVDFFQWLVLRIDWLFTFLLLNRNVGHPSFFADLSLLLLIFINATLTKSDYLFMLYDSSFFADLSLLLLTFINATLTKSDYLFMLYDWISMGFATLTKLDYHFMLYDLISTGFSNWVLFLMRVFDFILSDLKNS